MTGHKVEAYREGSSNDADNPGNGKFKLLDFQDVLQPAGDLDGPDGLFCCYVKGSKSTKMPEMERTVVNEKYALMMYVNTSLGRYL